MTIRSKITEWLSTIWPTASTTQAQTPVKRVQPRRGQGRNPGPAPEVRITFKRSKIQKNKKEWIDITCKGMTERLLINSVTSEERRQTIEDSECWVDVTTVPFAEQHPEQCQLLNYRTGETKIGTRAQGK